MGREKRDAHGPREQIGTDGVNGLEAAPHLELAVLEGADGPGRLQIGLVGEVGAIALLENLVRALKRPVHVAALDLEGIRHVARLVLVDEGGPRLEGLQGVDDGGDHLVINGDLGQGLLEGVLRLGGDAGDFVPHVADLVCGERGLVQGGDAELGLGGAPAGQDGPNPGDFLGRRGIDVQDPGVGVGAAEHPSVEHARKGHVRDVFTVSRDLFLRVHHGEFLADDGVLDDHEFCFLNSIC